MPTCRASKVIPCPYVALLKHFFNKSPSVRASSSRLLALVRIIPIFFSAARNRLISGGDCVFSVGQTSAASQLRGAIMMGYLRVDLNPLPVLFSEKDFKSNFRLSGNFVPVGQFFSGRPLNFLQIGSRKWGVGVKWKLLGRLGKMAARSDAARQAPPGHPGLQHTSFRPPSDAIPPRYCRDSDLPPYFRSTLLGIGWQST